MFNPFSKLWTDISDAVSKVKAFFDGVQKRIQSIWAAITSPDFWLQHLIAAGLYFSKLIFTMSTIVFSFLFAVVLLISVLPLGLWALGSVATILIIVLVASATTSLFSAALWLFCSLTNKLIEWKKSKTADPSETDPTSALQKPELQEKGKLNEKAYEDARVQIQALVTKTQSEITTQPDAKSQATKNVSSLVNEEEVNSKFSYSITHIHKDF